MLTQTHRERVAAELEQIRKLDSAKVLRPEAVVSFAENVGTALHDEFQWDDAKAAHTYRLVQARDIIRIFVTMIKNPNDGGLISMSTYTSLSDHRGQGYEVTAKVLSDKERRGQLLQDTIKRLQQIYELDLLPELNDVRKAIEKVARRYPPVEEKKKILA